MKMTIPMPQLEPQQKIRFASLSLRLGLAFVFLYAGVQALLHPLVWIGYIPNFVSHIVDAKVALDTMSVVQIVLAAWLVVGKWARYAGVLSVMLLIGIVLPNLSSLVITFRDIGLLTAAVAVVLLEL